MKSEKDIKEQLENIIRTSKQYDLTSNGKLEYYDGYEMALRWVLK